MINLYNLECKKKFPKKLNIKDFSVRINDFNLTNKKKIIYIKEEFEATTFRYRAYNVMQALEKSVKYEASCFLVEELKIVSKLLDKIDLIILQRCKWSVELESFVKYAKSKNKKIIYDMDDLIYDTKYISDYISNIGDYTTLSTENLASMSGLYKMAMNLCDGFIASTEKLQEAMKKDFKKDVYLFHNFLNIEQQNISENIVAQKKHNKIDNKFIIGYFSGSGTHVRDLDIALDAIVNLMDKYNDVYFEIVGSMPISDKLSKFFNNKRLIIKPLVPYQKLQYLIGGVDLNIIPLQKNYFNSCKSELKYFEASIVNTLSLATDNDVYGKIITDNKNGFLTDEFNWFEKLEYIYLNSDKFDNITENARKDTLLKYGCYNQTKKLDELFDSIIGGV